jgi:hypothetical protein
LQLYTELELIQNKRISENKIDFLKTKGHNCEPEKARQIQATQKGMVVMSRKETIYSVGTTHYYLKGSEVKQNINRCTRNGGYNG